VKLPPATRPSPRSRLSKVAREASVNLFCISTLNEPAETARAGLSYATTAAYAAAVATLVMGLAAGPLWVVLG